MRFPDLLTTEYTYLTGAVRIIVDRAFLRYTGCSKGHERLEVTAVTNTKYKLSYDEVKIIVYALVELKNQLIEEGRYTDAVDDILIKLMNRRQSVRIAMTICGI